MNSAIFVAEFGAMRGTFAVLIMLNQSSNSTNHVLRVLRSATIWGDAEFNSSFCS